MNTRHPVGRASTVPAAATSSPRPGAGIVSRLMAAGIDLVVVICLLVAVYAGWCVALFVLHTRTFTFPRPSPLLTVVAYPLIAVSYLAIAGWVNGRSYGQHVMGLRVTTQRGDRLRMLRALLRAAVCVGFPIGLLWVVVSRRNAAVHDLLLRTRVTYDWTG
jgi:uncharacterized RDD family membrane protein YckC